MPILCRFKSADFEHSLLLFFYYSFFFAQSSYIKSRYFIASQQTSLPNSLALKTSCTHWKKKTQNGQKKKWGQITQKETAYKLIVLLSTLEDSLVTSGNRSIRGGDVVDGVGLNKLDQTV